MLKILQGDLEAKEPSISVEGINSETSPNRYSSSVLYSSIKVFRKNLCFVTKIILQIDVSK